ncbi:hypothetical protein CFAM422_005217 [Trichoderma lentiforme]|uniref:mRNA stability protein n=1 Tax=Trichoderma lentiforme TaxID=1567552 RepID=A0A9P5CCQ7_9HYPO|nr:hypothetical protein CFAM422_005217 [Trichoderma lentiforme]
MEPKSETAKKGESDRETHLRDIYGIVPNRAQLLDHQLDKRTFFDSGDFALEKARKPSSMGSVTTGSQHPCREAISHPFCPESGQASLLDRSNSRKKGNDTKRKSHLGEEQSGDKS